MNNESSKLSVARPALGLLVAWAMLIPGLAFAQPSTAGGQSGGPGGAGPAGINRPDGWGRQQGPGQGKKKAFAMTMRELKLTPEQRQQLADSRPERQRMRDVVMRVKDERQKLQDVMDQEGASESEIQAQAEALKQVLADSVDAKIKIALSFKKVLTPDQYSKFRTRMQELREQQWQGRKKWHGRNQGVELQELEGESADSDDL